MSSLDYTNDHDILVAMNEQIKQVRHDIQDLKDGTSVKINDHEVRLRNLDGVAVFIKEHETTIKDHEVRLRRLELWGAIGLGIMYAIQFYFNFFHK